MTADRRPVLDSWKVRVFVAALSVGRALLTTRSPGGVVDAALPAPLLQWRADRHEEDRVTPWRSRVVREQAWLQAGVSVWVAWRFFTLERRAGR